MLSSRGTNWQDLKVAVSRDSPYSDTVAFREQHPDPCASDLPPGHRSPFTDMDPNRPYQNTTGIHDWRNWHWQDWPADARILEQPEIPTTLNLYTTPIQDAFVQEPSPYLNTEHQSRPVHGHWRSNFRSRSASALPTSLSWSSPSHDPLTAPAPRQIRFVSNDGQPHTKRRRIDKACQTCRRRKTRCSGERPECKTCSNNGHTCLGYAEASPTKRSRPSGSSRLHTPETGASQTSESPSIQEAPLLPLASTSLPTGSGVREPLRSAGVSEPLIPAFHSPPSNFPLPAQAKRDSDSAAGGLYSTSPALSLSFSSGPVRATAGALHGPGLGVEPPSTRTLAQPAPLRTSLGLTTSGARLPPFAQSRKRGRALDDVGESNDEFDSAEDTSLTGSPASQTAGGQGLQSPLLPEQRGSRMGMGLGLGMGFAVSPTSVPTLMGSGGQGLGTGLGGGMVPGFRGLRRSTSATFPMGRSERVLEADWGVLGVGRPLMEAQESEALVGQGEAEDTGQGEENPEATGAVTQETGEEDADEENEAGYGEEET